MAGMQDHCNRDRQRNREEKRQAFLNVICGPWGTA